MIPLSVSRAEDKIITWAVIELPPVTMFTIPKPEKLSDLGNGSTDIAIRAIAVHLPDYHHRIAIADIPRLMADMAAGLPICVGGALKTPATEKVGYFTERGITPPPYLIFKKKDQDRIAGSASHVALTDVLKRKELSGAIGAGRPFTPALDALIQTPGSRLKPIARYSQLFQQLDAGQFDYTVEFPYVAEYFNRQGLLQNELGALPLDEAATPTPVYVMCTRSPWGAQAIRDIDLAIRVAVGDRDLRQALLQWLPAAMQVEYAPRFDAYFKQRVIEPLLNPE